MYYASLFVIIRVCGLGGLPLSGCGWGIDWELCLFAHIQGFIVLEGEIENIARGKPWPVNQPHLGCLYWTDPDTRHPPIAWSIWHISNEQIVNHKEMKLITSSARSGNKP